MIYNYPAAARASSRAPATASSSHGDTEVVLKAYAQWGEDFVDHLLGMFAVVIVERDSGRVVLARDRLGIKPLYLAEVAGRAALRQHAARAAGRRRRRHRASTAAALHHYLSFHSVVPAPRTILQGVRKLPPATVRVIEPDGTQPRARLLAAAVHARPRARPAGPRATGRRPSSTRCASR